MKITDSKDGQRRLTVNVAHRMTGQEVAGYLAVHADQSNRFQVSVTVHLRGQGATADLPAALERIYGSQYRILKAVKNLMASGIQNVGASPYNRDLPYQSKYYFEPHEQLREAALAHVKKHFPELQ
jgi:hypothetical protein